MIDRRANFGIRLLCAGLLLLCGPAMAAGKLTGSARDSEGKPLVGVEVRMVPMQGELPTVTAKSNKKGKFVFGILRNADYRRCARRGGRDGQGHHESPVRRRPAAHRAT